MQAENWQFGIGDDSIVGWTTVIAYFVSALSCIYVYLVAKIAGSASFHHIDIALNFSMFGVQPIRLLELLGIAIILIGS